MVQSIIDDIKAQFRYGNKIVQIILVNFIVFLTIVIIKAFSPGGGSSEFFTTFFSWIALPSEGFSLLKKPWTLVTHMFVHQGFWHIAWNMLMLYWFGRIVGDLIGDRKILPLYFAGGIFGALFYLFFANVLGWHGIAFGASAAVMTFVVAAGFLAPEYNMRLLLLGDVKLKYIALGLVLLDLVMISESNNTGGRIAHLGGALFGGLYIYFLKEGTDLLSFIKLNTGDQRRHTTDRRAPMEVVHSRKNSPQAPVRTKREESLQEKIDEILDKINANGYDSLSEEDKEILFRASKRE
jgi:membrane associated rhomboid family serine protease